MKRLRRIEHRVFAAVPLVAVALGWVAIWMAWPKMPVNGARRQVSVGVSICRLPAAVGDGFRNPTPFGRPSSSGFHPDEGKESELSTLSFRLPLPPRLLGREETAAPAVGEVSFAGASCKAEPYVPSFDAVGSFPDFFPEKGLHVQVLGKLKDRRLDFPNIPEALIDPESGAWEVDLMIRITPAGRVASIMVQEASADAEVLRYVEHFVLMATADEASSETVGCVRIGYAKP